MTTISTTTLPPSEQITATVTEWPGVEAGKGGRGASVVFRLGRHELGHLHGDRSLHLGFPREVWAELRAAGRIEDHPVFPGRVGPAARRLETDADVRDAIALLRLKYDAALRRRAGSGSPS